MPEENPMSQFVVDQSAVPADFPTHTHDSAFWEALGRCVATFGFLEEVLGKAIFALTGTREYNEDEIQAAYDNWLPKLEHALHDTLGQLIDHFGKAARDYPTSTVRGLDDLVEDLRKASVLRNVICHGSWRKPDANGASIPLFVNKQMEVFETRIDANFLDQLRRHTTGLACSVINTVTQMGRQFPGSAGPGEKIW